MKLFDPILANLAFYDGQLFLMRVFYPKDEADMLFDNLILHLDSERQKVENPRLIIGAAAGEDATVL